MTPVQLPELPTDAIENVIRDAIDSHCPQGKWITGPNTLAMCLKVEMGAQLREYATEAVMAERARILVLADTWRAQAELLRMKPRAERYPKQTLSACADELTALLTPSETNSER